MTWKRVRLLVGVLGECPLVRDWLDSKDERSPYLPLKLIDGLVRGFSQVRFRSRLPAEPTMWPRNMGRKSGSEPLKGRCSSLHFFPPGGVR